MRLFGMLRRLMGYLLQRFPPCGIIQDIYPDQKETALCAVHARVTFCRSADIHPGHHGDAHCPGRHRLGGFPEYLSLCRPVGLLGFRPRQVVTPKSGGAVLMKPIRWPAGSSNKYSKIGSWMYEDESVGDCGRHG